MGGATYFAVSSINDDPVGAGSIQASCSWDNQTWFFVSELGPIYPTITQGTLQNLTLACRSIDHLGNGGPLTSLNVRVDSEKPRQILSPSSGVFISQNSSISVTTMDNLAVENRLSLVWSNATTTRHVNVTIYSTPYSISLNQIWTNLSDGSVHATLYSTDEVGNQNASSTHLWYLNTSLPISVVTLQGNYVNTYVPSQNFTIQIVPPTVGNANGWAIYSLEHSNGSLISTGNISNLTELSFCEDCSIDYLLSYGFLYLNISSFDFFGRSQSHSWIFTVDLGVGTFASYSTEGETVTQSTGLVLGPDTRIKLGALQDDVGGVGASHARCTWSGSSWFNISSGSYLDPNTTSGAINSFSLRCSVVDHLGYIGALSWLNGSVDAQSPTINFSLIDYAVVSPTTGLSISCVDTNGCQLVTIYIKYQQGANITWFETNLSGTTASLQLSSILNVNNSGYLEVYVEAEDGLGNPVNTSLNGLLYLHDTPTVSTQVSSTHSGNYINQNVSLTFTPSSGWVSGLEINVTIIHSNYTSELFSGLINETTSWKNFSSLYDGNLWVNSTVCDALNRCSNSTTLLLVDSNGPQLVNVSGASIHYLANGSAIVNGAQSLLLTQGTDLKSGVQFTHCSGNNGFVQFSTSDYTISAQSLVSTGDWRIITCHSVDKVGNIGQASEYTVFIDNELPTLAINYSGNDGVITPTKWLNASCEDETLLASSHVQIWTSNALIYQSNGTNGMQIRYGMIPSLAANMMILIDFSCMDVAGNQNTI